MIDIKPEWKDIKEHVQDMTRNRVNDLISKGDLTNTTARRLIHGIDEALSCMELLILSNDDEWIKKINYKILNL